jgi:hypothetical protein
MKTDESTEGTRDFGAFLRMVNDGSFQHELSSALYKVNGELAIIAGNEGSAKGQLTITVNLKHDESGTVTVEPVVKVKVPEPRRRKSTFWLTPGGNLSPNNPKQTKLEFRDVSAPAAAAKDVIIDGAVVKKGASNG